MSSRTDLRRTPVSTYEANTILIPKPYKDNTKRKRKKNQITPCK
jgi:hypothetical protein